MQRKTERMAAVVVMIVGLMVALAAPAAAAKYQISGVAFYDDLLDPECDPAPAGYDSIAPIVMTGSLDGCWYTKVVTPKDNGAPSGVYQERGVEIFVGTLVLPGPDLTGTFETTFKFSSKWDPDVSTGVEVKGRCQHPIIAGSGDGGFEGVTGRLDFKDDVTTGLFLYRGHLTIP